MRDGPEDRPIVAERNKAVLSATVLTSARFFRVVDMQLQPREVVQSDGKTKAKVLFCCGDWGHVVEVQIELEDVDAGFAEES